MAIAPTAATGRLAEKWARDLASWAIPDDILAAAAESPWTLPVGVFAKSAETDLAADPGTPSLRRALEPLARPRLSKAHGERTVLDVGAGAGAASLPLVPPATRVIAVDENEHMLEALHDLAGSRQIEVDTVLGRWPDVAEAVPRAEVVVCHHVLYNVADLVPFVLALDGHARSRVVVEITTPHPLSYLNDLWRQIHGLERPNHPTAGDAVEIIRSLGADAHAEHFSRPSRWSEEDRATRIVLARRSLCARPEHDEVINRMLGEEDRGLVTIWWDTGGGDR